MNLEIKLKDKSKHPNEMIYYTFIFNLFLKRVRIYYQYLSFSGFHSILYFPL